MLKYHYFHKIKVILSIKNFRRQIILSACISFVLLWGGGIIAFGGYLSVRNKNQLKIDFKFEKTSIVNNIKRKEKELQLISKKIIGTVKNKPDILSELSTSWNKINLNKNNKASYYDYELKNSLLSSANNWGVFSQKNSEAIPSKILYEAKSIFDGKTFGYCNFVCKIIHLQPVNNHSKKRDLLQISSSMHNIVNNIKKDIGSSEIFLFYKTHLEKKDIEFHGINYLLDISSNKNLFDMLKDNLSLNNENENIKVINILEFQKTIFYIKTYDFLFLMIRDTTSEKENINKLYIKYTLISFTILLFIIFAFFFFLKIPIKRIHHIKKMLDLIGQGQFSYAEKELNKTRREKIYDELDMIHNETRQVAQRLESMHQNLKNKIHEISFLADHDTLTGLYNRRRFNKELINTHSANIHFALISIDLNHFKLLNDSMGHAMGDLLLKKISYVFRDCFDENSVIGRTGGDEFSIISKKSNINSMKVQLKKFVRNITSIKLGDDISFRPSAAIGIAFYPKDAKNIEDLSVFSDAAMYENKKFKTSDYNFYNGNETLLVEEEKTRSWNRIIKETFETKNVLLLFQPIVIANSKEIHGFEVLSRIKNNFNIIPPDEYIGFLEKNHDIIKYDKMIIENALDLASQIATHPRLMINLSSYTLSTASVADFIIERCQYYNYSPKRIVLEITESIEIDDFSAAAGFMMKLKNYGFSFALDDFGAGFSTFNYLTKLPFSYIKIDKKIITGLLENPVDHHVMKSITLLAKSLEIKIIAEGIENLALANTVNTYDVDFLQGYYFSHPKECQLLGEMHTAD